MLIAYGSKCSAQYLCVPEINFKKSSGHRVDEIQFIQANLTKLDTHGRSVQYVIDDSNEWWLLPRAQALRKGSWGGLKLRTKS